MDGQLGFGGGVAAIFWGQWGVGDVQLHWHDRKKDRSDADGSKQVAKK